jgi:hypothetical protein
MKNETGRENVDVPRLLDYQAILARMPLGYRLTTYFLPSSSSRIPMAKVKGIKMCSTGTP